MSSGIGDIKGKGHSYNEGRARAKNTSKSAKKTEIVASKKRERTKETGPVEKKSYHKLESKKPGPIKRAALAAEANQVDKLAKQLREEGSAPPPLLDKWVFSYIKRPTKPQVVTACVELAGVVYGYALGKTGMLPADNWGINYLAKGITRLVLERIIK